jgi:2-amino-4-hydroxy-6-hydroxymethyldihydropteridine diphosphokinase
MNAPHHFLLLGSNADPVRSVAAGLFALRAALPMLRRSSVYRTPAVGTRHAPSYMNLAVAVACSAPLDELKGLSKDIERAAGRTADASARGEIALDIDVVMSTDLNDRRVPLTLHRPAMVELGYCYVPMAEIALEYLLPLNGIPTPARRHELLSAFERFALSMLLKPSAEPA